MSPVRQHPAGLTTLAASAVVIVAAKAGLELTAEEAAVFVGLIGGVVSWLTPRWKKRTLQT